MIRAGYGLYYHLLPIELQAARAPFVFTETPFTNPAAPSLVLPAVFPSAGTAGSSAIALPLAVNPDVQMPYTISGASPSSTSDGAPASVCRTSARWAARCGTRATQCA